MARRRKKRDKKRMWFVKPGDREFGHWKRS
jgi:hypothetical protein